MRRRRVEVEVVLLHVLAVIAFAVRETEQPFLEDCVAAIPQCDAETQPLLVIGYTGNTVLAPAIGTRARVIVREEVPRIAVLAVILTNGAPLPLAQIRAPFFPGRFIGFRLGEPLVFRSHGISLVVECRDKRPLCACRPVSREARHHGTTVAARPAVRLM